MKVGYQGETGSYSEIAAIKFFANFKSTFIPFKSFHDLFDNVENALLDAAVIPIENSIEGSVNETYDLLMEKPLFVVGEIYQRVRHCLIANNEHSKIEIVYSHPQALAQCRSYLRNKSLEPVPFYDTAGSVKYIKENSFSNCAAIASRRAAEIYNMKIVEEGIEDKFNNFTRFLIISKDPNHKSANNKTSIIFSISHKPGSLFLVLKEFASRNINLTKIESRPKKDIPWEYYFFVDFEDNSEKSFVKESLLAIKNETIFFKLLGSYEKAEIY
ncbi:MAG: prephenate dehydratase [Thermoproteota archaeon]|nr:prephenate dehydratase [Thermoproteota archaeon]